MKFLDPEKGLCKRLCSFDPITLAVGGSAIAGAGGNIFSSIMGGNASKKQAEAMKYAADRAKEIATEARDTAWSKFSDASAYQKTFYKRGMDANVALSDFIMSGGNKLGGKNVADLLQESALFKFESNLGQRDMNRQLKARGLYGSGAGLEALGRFENELVAKEGQRFVDRTMGGLTELSRTGFQAGGQILQGTTQLGGATMQLGANTADVVTRANMGAAQATGQAGQSLANLVPGILGPLAGGANTFAQYDLFKPVIDSIVKKNASGGPLAPGNVTAMVNPDTAPLGMSNPAMPYLMGDFSMNFG